MYVDSFDSKHLAPSSEHDGRRLIPGMPVKVTHGKHEGKRGILSSIRRYVSVVVEDQSAVQVKILIIKTVKEDKLLTLHPSYLSVMSSSSMIRLRHTSYGGGIFDEAIHTGSVQGTRYVHWDGPEQGMNSNFVKNSF